MTISYDDIIHLPHPVSSAHQPMSIANRAAQFAPFAALAGHDEALKEAARLTHERVQLCETRIAALNEKLRMLADAIAMRPNITVVYFQPDNIKKGGMYAKVSGALKKIDAFECALTFVDEKKIAIEDIVEIESKLFEPFL